MFQLIIVTQYFTVFFISESVRVKQLKAFRTPTEQQLKFLIKKSFKNSIFDFIKVAEGMEQQII